MNKNKKTLTEIAEELKRKPETIQTYVKDFSKYLGIKAEKFDFLFDSKLITKIELIRNFKRSGLSYADITEYLNYLNHKNLWPYIFKIGTVASNSSLLIAIKQDVVISPKELKHKLKERISIDRKPIFRSKPKSLSKEEVKIMIKRVGFYDSNCNERGKGFRNLFKLHDVDGDKVVIDHASGLMWQQGGSAGWMSYIAGNEWIEYINLKSFAGYCDWRLPTLEEAMSLLKTKENWEGLYINSIFNENQRGIWTCDKIKGNSWAWVVSIVGGCFYWGADNYVRAVRSGQSSAVVI